MKRPWTRGEKSLFLAPPLFLALAGGAWLWNASQAPTIKVEEADDVSHLQFSPDGKRLVGFFSSSKGRTRFGKVFDVENRSTICDLEEPQPLSTTSTAYQNGKRYFLPSAPNWSPDGKQIVAGYSDNLIGNSRINIQSMDTLGRPNKIGKIAVWDAQSGADTGNHYYAPVNEDSNARSVRFSGDGKTLIGDGKPPAIFDAKSGKRLHVWKGKLMNSSMIKVNQQLGIVAEITYHNQNRLQIIETLTKQTLWKLNITPLLGHIKWKGDLVGVTALNADNRGQLMLWNATTQKLLPSPPSPKTGLSYDFQFNPVTKTLVYTNLNPSDSSQQCEMVAWDYGRHRVLWRQRVSTKLLGLYYQWSPDGQWLSVANTDKENTENIFLFDHTGKLRFKRAIASSTHAWSPDSKKLAVTNKRGQNLEIEVISVPE